MKLRQNFSVDFSYPVAFGHHYFSLQNHDLCQFIEGSGKCMVVVDDGVATAFPELCKDIRIWFSTHEGVHLIASPVVVKGGEAIKNDYRCIMSLVDQMLEYHLCRQSTVIVIGGGAVLDAVGFATSLVHRGLRLVRMPSTPLAQNDAGIGVKNGMNLHGGKNTIGVFAPPYAVVNDFSLLSGLSDEQWRAGISEAFKVAMIKDRAFFYELADLAPALGNRDDKAMERLIVRCAELHLDHIATSGDPFEKGSARPLDFGHWSAHKLEAISHYRIGHGQAVAIGILLDARYATRLGWLAEEETRLLQTALEQCGFNLSPPELFQRLGDGSLSILRGLEEFREHLGGQLTLSFPCPLGSIQEVHDINPEWMTEEIHQLQESRCN